MDRNREGRRAVASTLPVASNGLSRRRHRTSNVRDSPEDDGPEMPEPARLRDRGIRKDRDRERERERERERSRSSKRRRADRMMNAGDESSEEEEDESVNDEEEDDDDVAGSFSRMLPPLPNPIGQSSPLISSNHHHSNNSHHQSQSHNHNHLQHRKSYPPAKVFKAASTVPAWKVTSDEMIGVSVPRKARTASTKRSHDWISGGGGGGEQMIHRQASTSPVRQGGVVSSTQSPAPVRDAPLSPPSSSNVSIKKKIKPNGGGAKPRPQPRSTTTSKSSSSNNNPEELEIEIAEVLYGLMTQSQGPSKNDLSSKHEFNNKSSSENKSRASSPVSNSSSAAPLSVVAPKRKKPRQLAENNLVGSSSTRSCPAMKVEIDQTPRSEICSPNLESNLGSAAENGESANSGKSLAEANQQSLKSMKLEASTLSESKGALMEEAGESRDAVSTTKEEVNFIKKDATVIKLKDDSKEITVTSMATATNVRTAVPASEKKREEKFQIDLMAPPPQLRSSPERDGSVGFVSDQNRMVFDMEKRGEMSKNKETDKVGKITKEETVIQSDEKSAKAVIEEVEFQKSFIIKERSSDLHFDLEKPCTDTINNSQNDHAVKSQLQHSKATFKEEQPNTDKSAQSISLPLPMTVASWPGGISPPIGYMAPLQGVVSMEGASMPSAPIQPLFSQPRPKRCATHCHIARNINYYQQLMKMNPFWPAPAGTAMFAAKPSNVNVIPPAELQGNISGRSLNSIQDKGHSLAIFPGNAGKEKFPQPASIPDAVHGKQQILLQQAMPPVPPNNILQGPAFIFPFNQQQAAVVAASGRPASAKSLTATGSLPSTGAPNLATVTASAQAPAAASALGFNYPNMSANETQYLVLQNSPYPFPIPAVGAPPNFRGHAQPMPMFNGSFYPSQMIHPLQLQQQQAPASQQQQQQQIQQTHQNSSSSSMSSQKQLQSQQHRPQGIAINGGGNGGGVLHNFPAQKSRASQHPQQQQNQHINPAQARQLENEVGGEDSPSAGDNRGSRAPVNIYNQNFAMPIHPHNFALMSSPAASAGATTANSGNQNDKKQTHQQHQSFRSGVESLPSQTYAMSFGPMIGSTSASGIDLSSMSQNHAILQSLPEATRQSYNQIMHAAATAQAAQQKKNSRMSEDGKIGGAVSSNADEERKVLTGKAPASSGGQSISFSRPDFADVSGSATPGNSVVDSSTRTLNHASGPNHMPNVMNSAGASNSHLHAQLQHQQQLIQMHNQQQHQQQQQQLAANVTARSKTPTTNNGIAYSEHLTSSSVAAKFPNSISGFPPNFVQSSNNNSPMQSPQWKNSNRISPSQVQSSLVSSTSSLKNHQQQHTRTLQNHTQISFGANQKSSASHGQQHTNSSQSPSSPVVVGSPTHSSLSKGAASSPRTNTASTNKSVQASALSSQQAKNSTSVPSQKSSPAGGRNVPSVLGNPHSASSLGAAAKTQIQLQQQQQQQQLQQQLSKQTLQQAMFFSNPYLQGQPPNSANSNTSAASGYYLQRRRPEQMQQSQQSQGSSASSSAMLSMCPPATQSSTNTTDPAKAAAAAAAASNAKGGILSSQGIIHSAQFGVQSGDPHQLLPVGFSYGQNIPAAVQVKPASEQKPSAEQKQPAGK